MVHWSKVSLPYRKGLNTRHNLRTIFVVSMSNNQIAEKLLSENQNCNFLLKLITCACGTFEVHCLLLKIVQKLFKNQINLIFVQLFKSCLYNFLKVVMASIEENF